MKRGVCNLETANFSKTGPAKLMLGLRFQSKFVSIEQPPVQEKEVLW